MQIKEEVKQLQKHMGKKKKLQRRKTGKERRKNSEANKKEYLKKNTDKDVEEFLSGETIPKTTAKALNCFHQTHIKNTQLYQANISVAYDCYIIDTDPVKRLHKKRLRHHSERLEVKTYMDFVQTEGLAERTAQLLQDKGLPEHVAFVKSKHE